MFNKVGFNHLEFNKTNLSSLVNLEVTIYDSSQVNGEISRTVKVASNVSANVLLNNSITREINRSASIVSNSNIVDAINNKRKVISTIESHSMTNVNTKKLIKSICTISEVSDIDVNINKILRVIGNIQAHSNNSVIVKNKMNVLGNIKDYSDIDIILSGKVKINSNIVLKGSINSIIKRKTFDGVLINGSSRIKSSSGLKFNEKIDVNSSSTILDIIKRSSKVNGNVIVGSDIDLYILRNIKLNVGLNSTLSLDNIVNRSCITESDLEIISYLLGRAKINDTRQAIKLIGKFLEQENIDNNIFVVEELVSGIMNNEIYLEEKCG